MSGDLRARIRAAGMTHMLGGSGPDEFVDAIFAAINQSSDQRIVAVADLRALVAGNGWEVDDPDSPLACIMALIGDGS